MKTLFTTTMQSSCWPVGFTRGTSYKHLKMTLPLATFRLRGEVETEWREPRYTEWAIWWNVLHARAPSELIWRSGYLGGRALSNLRAICKLCFDKYNEHSNKYNTTYVDKWWLLNQVRKEKRQGGRRVLMPIRAKGLVKGNVTIN